MSNATSRLQFVLSLIDRVSGPLSRIQARLHAMGLEQMALFRTNFHAYGNSAASAARRVALITTAITTATAATGALVAALAPVVSMTAVGVGTALGTTNAMGVSRESQQLEQQTGVSSVAVQLYRQAGRSQGLEAGFGTVGDVGQVFTDLNSKLAAPDDKLGETLKAVKLTLTDIKGLNADQVLQKVVNQAQKLGLNDIQASAVLDALAGDASKLLPLLKNNAAELNRLSHYAEKVGAVITPKQAQLLASANAEVAQIKTGVEGYGNILSTVGGNFMRLFGPEINQWFLDNADGMRQWADDSVKELQRLHGVFKRGGMRAVYEDLFPNLSAFTRRFGLFIDGFNAAFYTPFMAVVDKTWQRVSAVFGNAAGGAKGFGAAFGAALLPIFSATFQIIGDAVIFLEKNWNFVKQLFAWSPLGLIINNWGAIAGYLKPVGDAFKSVAESMGLFAPGLNDTGSAAGTVLGVLAALAGVLALNSLAFGAAYHIIKLYQGLMILLRASTMLVTVATWAFNGAMAVLTSPILLVVAAIAALAAGAYLLYQNWDTVRPLLIAFWDSIVAKWEQFKAWVSDLITNLGTAFSNGWNAIKTNSVQFVTEFIGFFTSLPSQFLTIGGQIMDGLFNGLKNAAGAVTNWVGGFVGGIVDDTESLLGINSPSKVFAAIGGFTIEGMLVGMESAQSSLMDYLNGLGDKLKGWWSDLSSTFSGSDLADGVKSAFAAVQNAGSALISPAVAGVQSVADAVTGGTATSAAAAQSTVIPKSASELGGLSAKYESNGNAGAIGFDKKGGWSYGKYQVATRTGTMNEFLSHLAKTNPAMAAKLNAAGGSAGAASGSGAFKNAWQDLAKNQAFSDAQHQFIQSTHYDPLVSRILSKTGIDINQRSKALQDVVWSTAVQHGGGTNVVEKALRATGKTASTVTDAELIKAIYNERAGRFGGSTASVRKSVQDRFVGEQAGALAMLNGGARALGGNVIPGHFYRVNERGPELLQTMGQTYLITGGMTGNIIPFPSAAERAQRQLSTTTSLLPRDVKHTVLRDLTAQQSPQSRSSNSARANKTIHIGSVHIHTNNKIDPFELEQQLSMLG